MASSIASFVAAMLPKATSTACCATAVVSVRVPGVKAAVLKLWVRAKGEAGGIIASTRRLSKALK
eukprot:scaffold80832_cov95-Phaeocystis_antarctica.AAC.2